MRTMTRTITVATLLAAAGALGCARQAPAPGGTTATTPTTEAGEAAEWAKEGTPPPADSPLAKVKAGMKPREVEAILGPPDDENAYITGKAFIPYYYGRDRSRQAYFYKGVGRVVFQGAGGFGPNHTVRFVDYDPSEDGVAQ
jgi:hypothetical protein